EGVAVVDHQAPVLRHLVPPRLHRQRQEIGDVDGANPPQRRLPGAHAFFSEKVPSLASYWVGLPRLGMPRATQSATQPVMRPSGTSAYPLRRVASLVLTSQADGASVPTSRGERPKRRPNACASARTLTVSGPLTLSGLIGTVAWPSALSAIALASP